MTIEIVTNSGSLKVEPNRTVGVTLPDNRTKIQLESLGYGEGFKHGNKLYRPGEFVIIRGAIAVAK